MAEPSPPAPRQSEIQRIKTLRASRAHAHRAHARAHPRTDWEVCARMSGEPQQQPGETATVVTVPPPGAFTALRYRDYRLLLIGQFVATIGQQMQTVAITY